MQTIPDIQIIGRMKTENPWWSEQHDIIQEYRDYMPREYFKLFYPLVKSMAVRRAVVLMGPRRVGKTVMIHHAIQQLLDEGVSPKSICYLSVDHPIYNGLRLDQLIDFFRQATETNPDHDPCYIFFDEIQYIRNWETHLKTTVDQYSKLKCVASGSSAAALRLKSTESGAGRFTDFLLPPLTFHEYLTLLKKNNLIIPLDDRIHFSTTSIEELNQQFLNYLNFGGYPEVIFSREIQSDPQRYIKNDIIDKVLLRDLPGLYGIEDIQELNYLFTTLALNTAQEISLKELSQNSGVTKNTLVKYIDYLEAAFLVKRVHRIDRNSKRFKRANYFKIYLTNPSMRSALFSPITSEDSAMGSLTETAIFSQWFHSSEALHYARWPNGEVDIVSIKTQKPEWAVEVKWSDRYFDRPKELKSLIKFCSQNNLHRVRVTTRTITGLKKIGDLNITFQPASLYCYTVGYNIVRTLKNRSELLKAL